jgi:hypothetical protein
VLPPPSDADVITERIASSRSILSSLSIRPSESISSNNCIDSVKDKGSETGVRGDVSPPAMLQHAINPTRSVHLMTLHAILKFPARPLLCYVSI